MNHILGQDVSIDEQKAGKTILMVAAQKGYIELVTEILERQADVNSTDDDNLTALHYAV